MREKIDREMTNFEKVIQLNDFLKVTQIKSVELLTHFVEMATLELVDEKIILAYCARLDKSSGLFHLEQRVLWFVFNKLKAIVNKKHWGTGVDVLKVAGQKGNLKDFILKVFASQKLSNYNIEVGSAAVTRDVIKVIHFFEINFNYEL